MKKAYEVLLGSNLLTLDLVKKILKPGIIFEKSIVPSERRIKQLIAYRDNGCKITAIDEEGGFINNSFKEFLEERFSLSSVKLTDKIFTWELEIIKNSRLIFSKYKNRFSVTGNQG